MLPDTPIIKRVYTKKARAENRETNLKEGGYASGSEKLNCEEGVGVSYALDLEIPAGKQGLGEMRENSVKK